MPLDAAIAILPVPSKQDDSDRRDAIVHVPPRQHRLARSATQTTPPLLGCARGRCIVPSWATRMSVLGLALATALLSIAASASGRPVSPGSGCRLTDVTRSPQHVRQVIRRHRYKILGESDVRTRRIRAVIALPRERGDGHGMRVFFFKSDHFVGTDSKAQSYEVEASAARRGRWSCGTHCWLPMEMAAAHLALRARPVDSQ
jgi:hypothetical protein